MKLLLPLVIISLLMIPSLHAQQAYTINGETYILKTEVEGPLTLLWNTIDGEFRYFSKKGEEIIELTNTRQNGAYQEEYKEVLTQQTADAPVDTQKVDLTLPSLHAFYVKYNKMKDANFSDGKESIDLRFRLGAFAGVTNSVYTENRSNAKQAVAGIDLEVIDAVKLKRHAMVVRFKQTFESSDYAYSASQFSLNYRFKFIKTPRLDIYANAKFAALTFSKKEIIAAVAESDPPIYYTESVTGSDFSAPLTFGIGADYRVGNGYLTFSYNDIVGLNVESNDEFPIDFTLGYKFSL